VLAAALVLALAVTIASPATPARAADGLTIEAATVYRVDPAAAVVRVQIDLRLTNTVADRVTGDRVLRTTFTGLSVPLQAGAEEVAVTGRDGTPTLTVEPLDIGVLAKVELARALTHDRSTTVTLTYVLRGAEPRSENPTRVNAALQAFAVVATGDPDLGTIRVEVPTGRVIVTEGEPLLRQLVDGTDVLTSGAVADPAAFQSFVTVLDREGLESVPFEVEGSRFTIEQWPGDTAWATFVQDAVSRGVPVLEDIAGTPWPREALTRITETPIGILEGYAGMFDDRAGRIELDEVLDTELVLHELSHAWLDETLFDRRWMFEGFAQELASTGAQRLGAPVTPMPTVSPDDPAAMPLDQWFAPAGADTAEERFGYDASRTVADEIAGEIGTEGLTAVLLAAQAGTDPYDQEDPPPGTPPVVDWRRLLDLLEEVGGAQDAEQVLRAWVLTQDQADELGARTAARQDFETVAGEPGGWEPPELITDALTAWEFGDVARYVEAAREVLVARDDVLATALAAGVEVPIEAERYEQAIDVAALERLASDLGNTEGAIERYVAAETAVDTADGLATRIGLIGEAPQTDVDRARQLLTDGRAEDAEGAAASAIAVIEHADDVGRSRLLRTGASALGVVVALVVLVALLRRRSARRARTVPDAPVGESIEPERVDG
jgi:hypothetical protein